MITAKLNKTQLWNSVFPEQVRYQHSIKTKLNANEIVVTEIFLKKNNTADLIKTKNHLFNAHRSIYQGNYWDDYLKKYPLPENVSSQLPLLKKRDNIH